MFIYLIFPQFKLMCHPCRNWRRTGSWVFKISLQFCMNNSSIMFFNFPFLFNLRNSFFISFADSFFYVKLFERKVFGEQLSNRTTQWLTIDNILMGIAFENIFNHLCKFFFFNGNNVSNVTCVSVWIYLEESSFITFL